MQSPELLTWANQLENSVLKILVSRKDNILYKLSFSRIKQTRNKAPRISQEFEMEWFLVPNNLAKSWLWDFSLQSFITQYSIQTQLLKVFVDSQIELNTMITKVALDLKPASDMKSEWTWKLSWSKLWSIRYINQNKHD